MQVHRRGEITWVKPSNQRRAKRVIEHGGQEAALDGPGRIQEGVSGGECDLDRSFLRVDRNEFPPEGNRSWRKRHSPFHCVPEGAFVLHIRQLDRRWSEAQDDAWLGPADRSLCDDRPGGIRLIVIVPWNVHFVGTARRLEAGRGCRAKCSSISR